MTINLAEIEARVAKATAGPWYWVDDPFNERLNNADTIILDARYCHDDNATVDISEEDAEFIAHAREDVPALIAEIKQLREALLKIAGAGDACACGQKYVDELADIAIEALGADIADYLPEGANANDEN